LSALTGIAGQSPTYRARQRESIGATALSRRSLKTHRIPPWPCSACPGTAWTLINPSIALSHVHRFRACMHGRKMQSVQSAADGDGAERKSMMF